MYYITWLTICFDLCFPCPGITFGGVVVGTSGCSSSLPSFSPS